jgi:hypothetical protein
MKEQSLGFSGREILVVMYGPNGQLQCACLWLGRMTKLRVVFWYLIMTKRMEATYKILQTVTLNMFPRQRQQC